MREPTVRKCPICGNMTAGVECFSCGFVFPDEEKIAAPYDLDPANDLFGEAGEEVSAPAMEALDMDAAMQSLELPKPESLSAGSVNPVGIGLQSPSYPPPNIKVRSAAPPAYPSPAAQPKPQPLNNNPPPPPVPPTVYPPADPLTSFVKAVADTASSYWWQLPVVIFLPTSCFLFVAYHMIIYRSTRLFRHLIAAGILLATGIILRFNGVDILGLDYYLQEFLDDSEDNYYN